jgi:hypothetical protein
MITALKETRGMVYIAADRIGCTADTIYNRSKVSAAVKAAMKTERGKVVDLAELKLFAALSNGEPWAIQMTLKTLGKDRGYVERTEHEHEHKGEVTLRIKRVVVDASQSREGNNGRAASGTGGLLSE